MKNNMLTGNYMSELEHKIDRIEKRRFSQRICAIIFFVVLILVCAGGILFGTFDKLSTLENRYKIFSENPKIASVDFELLSYKDVENIVEKEFLGNTPYQSLMGGYFCDKEDCHLYPGEDGQSTILSVDDSDITLSGFVASDINVKNGMVYYRNQNTRKIYTYEISSKKTNELGFENVGQFAVYDLNYIYIDLSKASLVLIDQKDGSSKMLVDGGVKSFAIAGNSILFLDKNHKLNKLEIASNVKTVIANNITTFSFDRSLWLQNNDKLIQRDLADNKDSEYMLGLICNHLFGITDKFVFFESNDGVYCHDIDDNSNTKLENGIFIGASNEKILLYDVGNRIFTVVNVQK